MSEQPHPEGVRLLPWWPSPRVVDTVILAMVGLALAVRVVVEDPADEAIEWIGAAVGVAVIVIRRWYPVTTLVVSLAATVGVVAQTNQPTLLMFASLFPLFTVSERYDTKWAAVAGAATVAVFAVTVLGLIDDRLLGGPALAAVAWPAFVASAGAAARAIRINLATTRQQAQRAEADREREAHRRVVEERLRIARDVHDLVAHHLAVINVQSGVAGHLVRTDPDAAEAAIEVTRRSAAVAVEELGELLGVLRSEDDGEPISPTPTLDSITDLISSFAASGLRINHTTTGTPRPLSEPAEVAAYRVLQEALTNAHKHGDGVARVEQVFGDDGLTLTVANGAAGNGSGRTGFGLVGMRERVEAVGGTLTLAEDDGDFTVTAVVPSRGAP